jgi:GDP/UDP-N,N'-diacetylbacillosamine 2-epimerase (hydrolysing)
VKIALLTSSRADYGIYFPLIRELMGDPYFSTSIIAFGTHLSQQHGYTVSQIEKDGFKVSHRLDTAPLDDSPAAIATSMAKTIDRFTEVWRKESFDLVFCLGDRYEMFAACASSAPFNLSLAHIHGGEETAGAIDDAFRHSITHLAKYHFAAAEQFRERIVQLKGNESNVYNVGSLSIDNLSAIKYYTVDEFKSRYGIDMSVPTILITFHPETVDFKANGKYVDELTAALRHVSNFQLVITMPNADTMGNIVRSKLTEFIKDTPSATGFESLGMLGYLSCMKHCSLMLGNSSSGYIEASYFPKYVIDIGNRQTGRIVTDNIHRCGLEARQILQSIDQFRSHHGSLKKVNIYGEGHTAKKIISIIKKING